MNNLKNTRKRLNVTQRELSEISKISQGLLSLYERGEVSPSIEKAKAIFKVLSQKDKNLSFSYLWGV